jgi:serine/threonine protein kinase
MAFRVEPRAEPIPGYRLMERLGGGGFGEVWKAEVPGGLHKAIKFVYGDLQTSGDDGMRAEQELKALSRVKTVRHPYILSLERFDIVENRLLIVMELADRNLWDRFRECQSQGLPGIPREELLRYFDETAEALDLMNIQYQLQHLDIKPQNLFLVHNHVKVADFGLVKDLQGMATTVTGGVTPVYAAPETFDGWVSRFSDQYSLAIVYQELLTGQRPFAANNVHQLIMQHVQGKPNLGSLPPGDQEVIGRALAKNPDDRHPNCQDMVRALRAASSEAAAARPASTPVPAAPPAITPPPSDDLEKTVVSKRGLRQEAPAVVERPTPAPPSPSAPPPALPPLTLPSIPAAVAPRPVQTGEGTLFPALVIGLGRSGLICLQQLRAELEDRFGSMDAVPQIRLLYVDTDPETAQLATREGEAGALNAGDVLLARLNRPSHFLKPREGRPRLDTWLANNMLYRIQRNQTTGGLRALGRLAFIDNYRTISKRMQAGIEACAEPDALARTAQQTGLGLRSSQPRAYVITGLAGGTGSGMFLDVAYNLRELLRQGGYAGAQVVGVCLLPPAEGGGARSMALGNAYAALAELNHFSSKGTTFTARFDEADRPIADTQPPFSRCLLLPVSQGADDTRQAAALVGQILTQELTSQLSRRADELRAEQTEPHARRDEPLFQAAGLFRFVWPRRSMLRHVARQCCGQLLERWIARDPRPVQDGVHDLVQDQWAAKQLGGEFLIGRLQAACQKALGEAPEAAFASLTAFLGTKARPALDPAVVSDAVRQLEGLLGQPTETTVLGRPGMLEETLQAEMEAIIKQGEKDIAEFTSGLFDEPGLRAAGADEAVRQAIALIDMTLKHHEPLAQELAERVDKGYERLMFLSANLPEILRGGRKGVPLAAELVELLKVYPKWRYQSMILRRVNYAYTSWRVFLSDRAREIGVCRSRLEDILRNLRAEAEHPQLPQAHHVRYLLPDGAATMREATAKMLPRLSAADLEALDRKIQARVRQQFAGVVHVCTASANLLQSLEEALEAEMITFVEGRVPATDAAAMFLNQCSDDGQALDALSAAYEDAAPELSISSSAGVAPFAVVGVPAGDKTERAQELVRQALPEATPVPGGAKEEIVVYREEAALELADLDQVGPAGQEAYQHMAASEHFSPHSRIDIKEWRAVLPA